MNTINFCFKKIFIDNNNAAAAEDWREEEERTK